MVSCRTIIVIVYALLVITVPSTMGSVVCPSSGPSTPAELQVQPPNAPSTGCSSQPHPGPSASASCFACGTALLSPDPFMPEEGVWSSWHPVAPLTLSSPPSTYWHPPA